MLLSALRAALLIALALVSQLLPGSADAARLPTDPAREARALEAEIAMAARQKIYCILRAPNPTLLIKAAGVTLAAIPATRFAYWGDAPPIRPAVLLHKSALRRPTIRPAAKAPSDSETPGVSRPAQPLAVLEVNDMPIRFQMELDHGLRIAVRPEPDGVLPRLREAAYSLAWYLARPLPTLWHRARGRPYTAVYLRLAPGDAQTLYWACADGSELLVLAP